ncbi:MAG: cysteine--tRNA ligase [Actinomycetota bacterium]|jgi:cysteinyl-tRNA synthetase|nr:cysteine--tRNA ligase [Actinomycetota bacterium]
MRIYNTATRRKEEFVPREEGKVAMYVCGPTVYNHIHIGNARTFISFDTIRRYLMWRGYEVTFVQNITDVDDKIIAQAVKEDCTPAEVAERYTAAFVDAMHGLNILDPTVRPCATQEIPGMIELAEQLIEGGHAYEQDGSVYFSVRSFPSYGKLSGRDIDEMRSGERDLRGGNFEDDKRDPLDFAVWKAAKPGEPSWPSPWGEGRPGWHIECSVMAGKYLGLPLDIHGGGSDLIFPHHENEIAQSEASSGKTFANCWMHGGMLMIDSEKMSKSLGNFLLAKDVVENYDVNVVRLLMLQTHYRSMLDYSQERLKEATTSFERIRTAVSNARWAVEHASDATDGGADPAPLLDACARCREAFITEMDDDFNTAGALGTIFSLVSEVNSFLDACAGGVAPDQAEALDEAVSVIGELLGVLGLQVGAGQGQELPVGVLDLAREVAGYAGGDPAEAVNLLLETRAEARAAKNWGVADAVRDGLASLGIVIEDTPAGARIKLG